MGLPLLPGCCVLGKASLLGAEADGGTPLPLPPRDPPGEEGATFLGLGADGDLISFCFGG